jgi:hypothetical protein
MCRSARWPGRSSAWRVALLLLALVAASAQQLAAQTHWHATAVQVDAATEPPAPAAPGTGHDDCLLCQIVAHAAAAAPPAALLLQAVAGNGHAVRVPPVWHLVAISQPAHSWQGRGPPTA